MFIEVSRFLKDYKTKVVDNEGRKLEFRGHLPKQLQNSAPVERSQLNKKSRSTSKVLKVDTKVSIEHEYKVGPSHNPYSEIKALNDEIMVMSLPTNNKSYIENGAR